MNILFILCCFIVISESVKLSLPMLEEDLVNISVKKKYICVRTELDQCSILYNATYYEGTDGNLITEVYYHGVRIYENYLKYGNDTRRLVMYAQLTTRIVLAIILHIGDATKFEYLAELREDMLEEFLEDPEKFENVLQGNDQSTTGSVLRNILCRPPKTHNHEYDELDEVDEEPYLLRGRVDITVEQLKKSVDEYMRENNLVDIDLSVPGCSGLCNSLKTKCDMIDSIMPDPDSYESESD